MMNYIHIYLIVSWRRFYRHRLDELGKEEILIRFIDMMGFRCRMGRV